MQDYRNLRVWQKASCNEFESDLILGRDVKLIPGDVFSQLGNEVSDVRKVLTRLIQTVESA